MWKLVHQYQSAELTEERNAFYRGANLLDAAGVLFHCYLLSCRLKAKEGLYIQAGGLFKARPVLVVWMHLIKKKKKDELSFFFFFNGKCIE